MPVRPTPDDHAALVGRLRAAGCVFAEDEAALLAAEADDPDALHAMTDRRVAGTPLEQVLGWAWFCGARVRLRPGVFVPRRRTEALVERAVALASPGATVVDLCCGSGAVGAAVVRQVPGARLWASDLDPVAAACTRENVPTGATVLVGDLDAALPADLAGRVDLLVVNAPYVPTDQIGSMPPEARDHEPLHTLDGGPDGLDLHRRVAAVAPRWLAAQGHLLVETSDRQAAGTAAACRAAGLRPRVVVDQDRDATVVVAGR